MHGDNDTERLLVNRVEIEIRPRTPRRKLLGRLDLLVREARRAAESQDQFAVVDGLTVVSGSGYQFLKKTFSTGRRTERDMMATYGITQPITRKEDNQLTVGSGCYTDDVNPPIRRLALF